MIESNLTASIIFISIPTVAFGGYFLLSIIKNKGMGLVAEHAPFAKRMFRAGHAHAGTWLILSLAAIPFIERAVLSNVVKSFLLYGFPGSALFISGGFFASALPINSKQSTPGKGIVLVYLGAIILSISCLILAIGLLSPTP